MNTAVIELSGFNTVIFGIEILRLHSTVLVDKGKSWIYTKPDFYIFYISD